MNISEYKEFICAELDMVLAKYGDIRVVATHPVGKLCEYQAMQMSVGVECYRPAHMFNFDCAEGLVVIMCDTMGERP